MHVTGNNPSSLAVLVLVRLEELGLERFGHPRSGKDKDKNRYARVAVVSIFCNQFGRRGVGPPVLKLEKW
jgi:hypothetical protein